ncbi:hypothetical protein EI42_04688 [Thermosporothrix hazakensis]|uniref:Uncharacterized protein n=1 Tax=Thermosporothrix hazakensis TaxID=644383 RepID=A0A326U1Y4_THEHA|nr:hypothetical protein EI42_04688 [Thermosporothrix hazakensis]
MFRPISDTPSLPLFNTRQTNRLIRSVMPYSRERYAPVQWERETGGLHQPSSDSMVVAHEMITMMKESAR